MKDRKQWITWARKSDGGKLPCSVRTGQAVDPTDPSEWVAAGDLGAKPPAFVLTASDPYFCLDIDNCIDDAGRWDNHAVTLVSRFPGALVETSVSGRGLHIFGRYRGARPLHGCRSKELGAELYTADRFIAIGEHIAGDADTDCTDALAALISAHFQPREVAYQGETGAATALSDGEVIAKALASKQGALAAFGGAASFRALWTADPVALGRAFPDARREWDASSADAALARHITFWAGRDAERIERIMRQSALVRAKWDREDYLSRTVAFAINATPTVWAPPATPVTEPSTRDGYQFLALPDVAELFAGYIYVTSQHRAMLPDGQLLSPQQFNAAIPTYDFAKDDIGKNTIKKPWEAFVENPGFRPPIAEQLAFEPGLPFDRVIDVGGRRCANTYRPVHGPRKAGDPARFLAHVAKLLPDERDQRLIIAYMAAVIQHKGVKFQWCPVIQGVEGNGKTLLTRVLFEALGSRYVHTPQAHDLGSKFNAWIRGKLLIGVEDIHVTHEQRHVIEVLKPLITNGDGVGIRAMHADEETSRICANFIINTNHRSTVPVGPDSRRFAIFLTAQQTAADLIRDGMDDDYFPELYEWLRHGGYAIVHEYLATMSIADDDNPATGCQRAPKTSTSVAAKAMSSGPVEQLIEDMIEFGGPGVRGGWISRGWVTARLRDAHARVAIETVRQILRDRGYVPHPALQGGRTNNAVFPDGGRAELWVLASSDLCSLSSAAEVAKAYEEVQGL